jgi:hypothetical protein
MWAGGWGPRARGPLRPYTRASILQRISQKTVGLVGGHGCACGLGRMPPAAAVSQRRRGSAGRASFATLNIPKLFPPHPMYHFKKTPAGWKRAVVPLMHRGRRKLNCNAWSPPQRGPCRNNSADSPIVRWVSTYGWPQAPAQQVAAPLPEFGRAEARSGFTTQVGRRPACGGLRARSAAAPRVRGARAGSRRRARTTAVKRPQHVSNGVGAPRGQKNTALQLEADVDREGGRLKGGREGGGRRQPRAGCRGGALLQAAGGRAAPRRARAACGGGRRGRAQQALQDEAKWAKRARWALSSSAPRHPHPNQHQPACPPPTSPAS